METKPHVTDEMIQESFIPTGYAHSSPRISYTDGANYVRNKYELFLSSQASQLEQARELRIGSYVTDVEDLECDDPAIIVYDHRPDGDFFTIKRADGHLSNRDEGQLKICDAKYFIKAWCEKQIEYPKNFLSQLDKKETA